MHNHFDLSRRLLYCDNAGSGIFSSGLEVVLASTAMSSGDYDFALDPEKMKNTGEHEVEAQSDVSTGSILTSTYHKGDISEQKELTFTTMCIRDRSTTVHCDTN